MCMSGEERLRKNDNGWPPIGRVKLLLPNYKVRQRGVARSYVPGESQLDVYQAEGGC